MSEHIVRQTRQKDAIRDVLNGCDEFISAQELHRKLEDRGEHIGLATVYRQLNALAEAGRRRHGPSRRAAAVPPVRR